MSGFFDVTFFDQAVQGITPILLAALAGTLCERVGLFNIALEGQMLVGAFAAVAGNHLTGSLAGGILAALCASTLFGAILGIGVVRLGGDAIIIGISLNLLASGLTSFLLRTVLGTSGTYSDPLMAGLPRLRIPGLADLPLLGPALGAEDALVYLSWLLVGIVALFLARTPWGLRLRGIGENPKAAVTLGERAGRTKLVTTLVAGLLCGLGGLQLALGNVTLFAENMTAGRGWIAVAAVMLGRARPVAVACACILFGFSDAIGLRMQGASVPSQLTDAAPYVVTLAALLIARPERRRAAMPTSTPVL
nr:ABC transporter permease [uncultured Lichenicoccus sp.]